MSEQLFTPSDLHTILIFTISSMFVSVLRLILVKGVLEPAAVWAFKAGYRKADEMTGDRLPGLPVALGGTPEP